MSKLYRTSRAPAGADLPKRNTRLYGNRDEQIAGASLRSRGCPNPDRAYVPSTARKTLVAKREAQSYASKLQHAQTRMLTAQRAVRRAKGLGLETGALAAEARNARSEYLKLTGGTDRRVVEPSSGSDGTKV